MEQAIVGFFLAFILSTIFFTRGCVDTDSHNQEHTADKIETRAQEAYQKYGNSVNWYKGDKHLEPWIKLTPEEKEQWRLGMNFCGHGNPQ